MKPRITWEYVLLEQQANDARDPCRVGPAGHVWRLTIEEGRLSLHADGCDECSALFSPEDEGLWMDPLVGRLVFHPDHPNLGGWHGLVRCDCGWSWEFVSVEQQ